MNKFKNEIETYINERKNNRKIDLGLFRKFQSD